MIANRSNGFGDLSNFKEIPSKLQLVYGFMSLIVKDVVVLCHQTYIEWTCIYYLGSLLIELHGILI